jgi:DNA-binding transcriptional MerR regulator
MIRIGDFARLARISVRALRHYEAKGLLAPAHVDDRSRYRYYDLQQLAVLERLLLLKDLGLPLGAIRSLLSVSPQEFRLAIERHRSLLQRQLEEQRAMLARVDALDEWLNKEGEKVSGAVVRTKSYPSLRALCARAAVAPGSDAITQLFEETELRARRVRADQAPLLLLHGAPQTARSLDVEVCIPVTDACRLRHVREIEEEPFAASITYRGPYTNISDVYRRMRSWLSRQKFALAKRPMREIYHRFGADQIGYRLPAHRVATSPQGYVTELAIPISRRSP